MKTRRLGKLDRNRASADARNDRLKTRRLGKLDRNRVSADARNDRVFLNQETCTNPLFWYIVVMYEFGERLNNIVNTHMDWGELSLCFKRLKRNQAKDPV